MLSATPSVQNGFVHYAPHGSLLCHESPPPQLSVGSLLCQRPMAPHYLSKGWFMVCFRPSQINELSPSQFVFKWNREGNTGQQMPLTPSTSSWQFYYYYHYCYILGTVHFSTSNQFTNEKSHKRSTTCALIHIDAPTGATRKDVFARVRIWCREPHCRTHTLRGGNQNENTDLWGNIVSY